MNKRLGSTSIPRIFMHLSLLMKVYGSYCLTLQARTSSWKAPTCPTHTYMVNWTFLSSCISLPIPHNGRKNQIMLLNCCDPCMAQSKLDKYEVHDYINIWFIQAFGLPHLIHVCTCCIEIHLSYSSLSWQMTYILPRNLSAS